MSVQLRVMSSVGSVQLGLGLDWECSVRVFNRVGSVQFVSGAGLEVSVIVRSWVRRVG